MEEKLDRKSRDKLRRIEERLAALDAGITRHEAKLAELREIRERVREEREQLQAAHIASPEGEPGNAPVETAPETHRSQRPIPVRRPPEAERVRSAEPGEGPPEHFWTRYHGHVESGRPQVVYPWPLAGEMSEAKAPGPESTGE